MMRTFARGFAGHLYAGGRIAAKLGRWEMTMDDNRLQDGSWRLHAVPVYLDAYWIEQKGSLTLELEMGPQRWRWRGVEAEAEAGAIAVKGEGAPEVTYG